MKNPFLIGESVYLRAFEREDAPLAVAWMNDQEITETLAWYRPANLQTEEEFIASSLKGDDRIALAIAVKESDRLIGSVGLEQIQWRERSACFGIVIGDKEEWGKGYGTDATRLMVKYGFGTLNLNRIWLHAREDNGGGIRAYEKAGFRREGVLRQEVYREGRYWDAVAMAILRADWDGRG
ncbi:MAG TPA: GNAT family protein [Candidatus Bathyarchaeia archaeon]|nr:GNAT family protein [Candidatus Bathyarchaeia archaeon]